MRLSFLFAGLALTVSMGMGMQCAHADVYGYLDADGVAHFSTEKLDERYQLFMQGDGPFDSRSARPAQRESEPPASPLAGYLAGHPNLKKVLPLVEQAAREFALEPALIKAVMAAESAFNPGAVSPKGAIGLMQIMPATAERYGLAGDRRQSLEQKLADPKTNIRLGARYLRDLQKLFPQRPDLVLAAYNAGEGAVQKHRNRIPPYAETRNYVQLVTQFFRLYQPEAQRLMVAANDAPALAPARIHMTIPARRNMPAPVLE
ncbi:Soluble lytic murein transglycosylase [Noviherbaspirillum humi]|uniref:Soluble lytic murein transglycosylase n=1 Tax=Noviherbaspirillum humi TaxID=1688639 RepID=A0A239GHN5_9BURK|nr:lytic transglycosylase domain-containing protein [Noviherbaspirillum humi]SNS68395.1 Soluble lytic murein transglycosylase [Noviherbaspirillum humi]